MTGVDIIGALLRGNAGVVAAVPVDQIRGGRLGEKASLPSLLVRCISSVELTTLKRQGLVRRVDRVSVTVRAASYRDQGAIMKLLPRACAGKTGTIAGTSNVAVTAAGVGPDVDGPGNSYEQAQDFRVTYDTPA